jgi:DNA helicase-2/ATP-dependent DNA helicase PcrA
MFIVGRGWNQYRFDKYLPLTQSELTKENIDSYERNRNLFYVCCSRPKKKLILFITFPVENNFKLYLEKVFKKENILTYSDFMKYKTCY